MTKYYYPIGAVDRPNKYRECQATRETLEYFKREIAEYIDDNFPVSIGVDLGSYVYRIDDYEMFLSPALYRKIVRIIKAFGIPLYTQKQ